MDTYGENISVEKEIGKIGNYYGGLCVGSLDGRFYWAIENYDGHYWEEIPESLYRELIAFEGEK